jgi:hypothetical protein
MDGIIYGWRQLQLRLFFHSPLWIGQSVKATLPPWLQDDATS